jgi:hypothetical protein
MKNFESTYALLVRSEDKNQSRLETLVYVLLLLSAMFSIWQFAHQSFVLPGNKIAATSRIVYTQRG